MFTTLIVGLWTLFCHAAEMRAAHSVRSVMTLIVVIFIVASFESTAGFARRVGARFQSLVGVKVERWSRA
jgi:hypothetical protein